VSSWKRSSSFRALCTDEREHTLERQFKCLADCAQCAEGRPPATREQITERSLVDVSIAREVSTSPTQKDSSSVDRPQVDRPFQGPAPIRQTLALSQESSLSDAVDPPWKARCYAFRAFRPRDGVAFGGPLLGDPDRRHRATAELLSGDFPIAARASLAHDRRREPAGWANRAARCAPECAHALRFMRRRSLGRQSPRGFAASRHRCRHPGTAVSQRRWPTHASKPSR